MATPGDAKSRRPEGRAGEAGRRWPRRSARTSRKAAPTTKRRRFIQRLTPSQAARLAGLDSHSSTDLYHTVRLAVPPPALYLEEGPHIGGGASEVVANMGQAIPTEEICVMGGADIESAPRATADGPD